MEEIKQGKMILEPITEHEKRIASLVSEIVSAHTGKQNAIPSSRILARLHEHGCRIDGTRLRKIISYLRLYGIVKLLCASSKGYYLATCKEEAEECTESLNERGFAILAVSKAMKKQTKRVFPQTPNRISPQQLQLPI